jgi:hypothetical protein
LPPSRAIAGFVNISDEGIADLRPDGVHVAVKAGLSQSPSRAQHGLRRFLRDGSPAHPSRSQPHGA